MTTTMWKAVLAVGVVSVFSAVQIHLQSDLDERAATQGPPTVSTTGVPVFGKVITSGGKTILNDGNQVSAGTTVFSGSSLRTLDSVSAAILLGPLGKIEVAPKTSFRVSFDSQKVEVELAQGGVILTTNEGISGSVKTAAGATERIGPEKQSVIDVYYEGEPSAALPVVGQAAAARAGAGVVDLMYGKAAAPGVAPLSFAVGSGSLVTEPTAYAMTADSRPAPASRHKP